MWVPPRWMDTPPPYPPLPGVCLAQRSDTGSSSNTRSRSRIHCTRNLLSRIDFSKILSIIARVLKLGGLLGIDSDRLQKKLQPSSSIISLVIGFFL